MRIDKNTTIKLGDRNIVKIKIGDSVIWEKKTEPEIDYFYIESLGDGNTISVKNRGNGDTTNVTPTLEYSTDKNTWNTITFDWTSGTHTTELPVKLNTGEKMYFRNDTRLFSNSSSKYISFSSTVSSNVGGDIRTLSNYIDVDSEIEVPKMGMFYNLFYNNKIVDASNLRLPYTSLAVDCYGQLFYGCSSLTTVPELPSTKLASSCYNNMFNGCSSLTTSPELPATTLASNCYQSMFRGCSKLTTSPELPATTLANACCNQMFYGCTSLQTSPTLFATTLTSECYRDMFYGCSKLNSITVYADDISGFNCIRNWLQGVASTGTFNNMGSATYTINSVSGIPTGWVEKKFDYFYIESLGDGNTISVINKGNGNTDNVTPTLEYSTDKKTWNTITFDWTNGTHTTELPVKLNTGEKMYFRNDTHLFSNSYNKYISFSSSVSSNVGGDIRTLSNYIDVDNEITPQSYMFYRLFYNNKNIVDASNLRLPYTTLADYCYGNMFYGCSKLTTAPELPALTLAPNCYQSAFEECTSLVNPPALPATVLANYCYQALFKRCSSLISSPELHVTTLVDGCYFQMYYNCSSLNSITVYADDISANSCLYGWLAGVASSGTFRNLGSATYTINSGSGIPTGWVEVKS